MAASIPYGAPTSGNPTSGAWSSRPLPAGEVAEAVRTALSRVHLPWTLTDCRPEPHGVGLAWHALGDGTLVEYRGAPCAGYRRAGEIRRTEGDQAGLLLVVAGRERVRQGETAVELGAGDLFLWDGRAPIDFQVPTPLHKLTLLVPRERMLRTLARTAGGAAVPWGQLDAARGVGALIAGHLAALGRHAGDLGEADGPLAVDFVLDLVARLAAPAARPASGLAERIVAHVERRLDDPALTPTRLAAALGVTPRYLHMAFAETGETVAAHIRTRRLDRMRADLADPRLADRTVTEIALAWGFSDPAHASRAFRRAYGTTPSGFRAAALGRAGEASGED